VSNINQRANARNSLSVATADEVRDCEDGRLHIPTAPDGSQVPPYRGWEPTSRKCENGQRITVWRRVLDGRPRRLPHHLRRPPA
jgi:hypothetical protein